VIGPKYFQSWKKAQSEHSISTSISGTDGTSHYGHFLREKESTNIGSTMHGLYSLSMLIWSPYIECEIPSGNHVHSKHVYVETNYIAVGGISEAPFTMPSKTAGNGYRKASPLK